MLKNLNAKKLATTGIISAIYVALTLILMPISFGTFQVRISEALTILPLLIPESIIGLTLGCLISNLFGYGAIDVIFGTLATFLSAILTYFVGKKVKKPFLKFVVGAFFPVIINAIIVPLIFIMTGSSNEIYILNFLSIFVGQFISVYLVGINLYYAVKKFLH